MKLKYKVFEVGYAYQAWWYFLVALPLCLGIAVASGAPPFAGIITGIIGGIVVGILSGSNVSVSGPAAGLDCNSILLAITDLGFETFLLAVVIAGLIQLSLGFCKSRNYFKLFSLRCY